MQIKDVLRVGRIHRAHASYALVNYRIGVQVNESFVLLILLVVCHRIRRLFRLIDCSGGLAQVIALSLYLIC